MIGVEANLASVCEAVPGVGTGALVLVPERLLLGRVGAGSALAAELCQDREGLATATVREGARE